MKKAFLPLLLISFSYCYAQQQEDAEKKIITEKLNQFFKALETKDTILYHSLVLSNGQIWSVKTERDTVKMGMRDFSRDIANLFKFKMVIDERPFSYDIKIHNNIAIVWAPYTLSVDGKFSHCGVDVFTLLKSSEGWKIVSLAYSVEPNGCASLQK